MGCLRDVYARFTQGLRVVYAKFTQDLWIYRGWLVQQCSGRDPLVVSPAEGATRRSVTVSRDQPAQQPLREQEQIRAVMWQSQGVSIGAPKVSQSEDWIANVRRRVVSQAGVFTPCVSQERRIRLELRESSFTPRSEWSSAWHSHNPASIAILSTLLACSNR